MINVDEIKNILTSFQLLLVHAIKEGNHDLVKACIEIDTTGTAKESIQFLLDNDLIYEIGDFYLTTDNCSKFWEINKKQNYFIEFYDEFPISVTRPDGTKDYLRNNKERARLVYNRIVKSPAKHKEVMDCLKFEKEYRRINNAEGYMKRMSNWLASAEWETWKEHLNEEKNKPTQVLGYGQKLI